MVYLNISLFDKAKQRKQKLMTNVMPLYLKKQQIKLKVSHKLRHDINSVRTQRCFYTTSITLERRRLNVSTTLCAYWEDTLAFAFFTKNSTKI